MKANTALNLEMIHHSNAITTNAARAFAKKIYEINDYLGNSATRFFGSGYRKVSYSVLDTTIKSNEISATAIINYPQDWSIKKEQTKLKPHLSSIDTLLLSTHLAGKLLVELAGSIKGFSLNHISVNAGSVPLLELDSIPANLICNEKSTAGDRKLFKFDGKIGNMNVGIEVIKENELHDSSHDSLLASEYIRSGFKAASHQIQNIEINDQSSAIAAFKKLSSHPYLHSLDFIDAFVTTLQIGQVLLYELDGLSRANSNNLWMRSIKMSKRLQPYLPGIVKTKLDDLNIFEINQQRWRSANIVGWLANININCLVAHQLPIQE